MINHPNRKAATARKTAIAPRAAPAARAKPDHDYDYAALLVGARTSFHAAVSGQARIFTTDVEGLWEAYLSHFQTTKERQVHNCHCCRRFIEAYGGLVTINDVGLATSVMWCGEAPAPYSGAFTEMATRVAIAKVNGVFLTKSTTWGTPETGEWKHLSVVPPAALVHRDRALDPNQAAAAVRENVKTVAGALAEYGPKVLDEALRLLDADVLTRAEKFVGPVRWLRQLHDRPKGGRGQNVLWRAVAAAPEGFCHIKSSILGPLLDDIVAGVPFADIQRKHASKLHPLQYQRPQAAPAAGNVRAAEALVEKLGIAPSLDRRFARLDELPLQDALWVPPNHPTREREKSGGVFDHLKTKQESRGAVPSVDLPAITMTWDKFLRTVLVTAERIEMLVPGRGFFYALTTAANAEAPPILKWDRDEERNPFAWYTYHGGSIASSWKMAAGGFVPVTAMMAFPNMWGSRPQPHLHVGALLLLEGCADTRTGQGNALFPECLRDDLHGARSTLEAYSKSAALGGRPEASACGYGLGKETAQCELRVLAGGAWNRYSIDRWD